MMWIKATGIGLLSAAALALPWQAQAQVDFGEVGEPVHLVVGYQPYYTGSWSGVVLNGKELWKEYLPEGSTVEFQVGLQGAIVVNAMTGEKQHIGYVGDMPAIAATFRHMPQRGGTDIRIVATLGLSTQMCNIFLAGNDAPEFENGEEAVAWMDGKIVGTPHGSCTDRFAREAFEQVGIEPASYLNQNIEVITTNFRAGKLDAAVMWEPTATKIVEAGLAKRVASGSDFGINDGGFIVMLNDLIEQRPDVVKGWLQAELDAQLFMADPANAEEVAAMATEQTEQISEEVLWAALYHAPEGASDVKLDLHFVVTDEVRKLLDDATAFLYELPQRPAAEPQVREEAVMDEVAREILEERGLEAPIGKIESRPMSDFESN